MPRAHRYFLPGLVWPLTHRCHKQEFLLNRLGWLRWLFEAKKRYGLCVLNSIVTSNHIHLLVLATGEGGIAQSMQRIAGRTVQDYNRRKRRTDAFWEDRSHATAIQTGESLARWLAYIDMNMVRAGVVRHPGEWKERGYEEIQNPLRRYGMVNVPVLMNVLGLDELKKLQEARAEWIERQRGKVNQGEATWAGPWRSAAGSLLRRSRRNWECEQRRAPFDCRTKGLFSKKRPRRIGHSLMAKRTF